MSSNSSFNSNSNSNSNHRRGLRTAISDKTRTLTITQQYPDCGTYGEQTEYIHPGHQIEILEDIENKRCPNCNSNNYDVDLHMEDTKFYPENVAESCQRKMKEGPKGKKFVLSFKGNCSKGCTPYNEELILDPPPEGKKLWEPSSHTQRCTYCNENYRLDWTVTERNYI